MIKGVDDITQELLDFYEDNIDMPDLEIHMTNFLYSKIVNNLKKMKINNFGDWLELHREDNLEEILTMCESYNLKAMRSEVEYISLRERVLIYNAVALYGIEMDVDRPTGKLMSTIIYTFIEVIRCYNLFIKGYLSLRGELLISDRKKFQFYNVWGGGSVKKEVPVNLFKCE